VVISIDPDFLFLKPFGAAALGLDPNPNPQTQGLGLAPAREVVRGMRGHPVGQRYGLGDNWIYFNLTKICGPDSPVHQVLLLLSLLLLSLLLLLLLLLLLVGGVVAVAIVAKRRNISSTPVMSIKQE